MISVIVATYNSAATLARTLESLAAQRDADFEVLVADGGSQDGTLSIVDRFTGLVTHRISGPDRGVYDAWNKVVPAARGEWVMFLGSDDWLHAPDTLARLEAAASALPPARRELAYVFGQTLFREGDALLETFGAMPIASARLGSEDYIPFSHTGLLHHRSLFATFGLFDAGFRSAGDYEFLLRTMKDGRTRFHHAPLIVAEMAIGGMSTGAASRVHHYREMLVARRKLGFASNPGWLLANYRRARISAALIGLTGERITLLITNLYRRMAGKELRGRLS
ncbi:glycosyltransferase family 2 protein [Tsuneonella sp. CC-YZS046]|uniref:glycosyltransferase family 2 protein n=1 Tax=Tsuneonella sp. CC-YZS046 TaxID=3042152 RepID=UPI002D77675F|nr:glycosyltransferase family 2 protein [Tsuneonella sp. CC-YZS046]WRO66323.1 glycosyltransferase family 2 protein [Tsuneonella sp. CC-YZS046]